MEDGAEPQATSHRIGAEKQRLEHLDMVRGLAALAVCIGHVRSFVMLDYGQLPASQHWFAPFYVLTGMGGQAVMLFFALSGFLVGGPAFRRIHQKSWDFPDYSIHRFTRLWTALIPALVMTFVIDWLGRDWLHLAGYTGEYQPMIASGPHPGEQIYLDPLTFLGNIAFQMTATVPVYGSDGPLWSLAYEFAYYFTVPLLWFAVRGGAGWGWRVLSVVPFAAMLAFYPHIIPAMGTIWIAGGLAYLVKDRVAALSPRWFAALFALTALAAILLLALLFVVHLPGNYGQLLNAIFGCACAATLPFLARLQNRGGWYGRLSFGLSEISFTLYVVHFPLALFLWLWLFAPAQYAWLPWGLPIWLGITTVSLLYAWAMWWLFERNTGIVRKWTQRKLLRRG